MRRAAAKLAHATVCKSVVAVIAALKDGWRKLEKCPERHCHVNLRGLNAAPNSRFSSGQLGGKRWSQDFRPAVKMDRLMRKTIQHDETKEPFA